MSFASAQLSECRALSAGKCSLSGGDVRPWTVEDAAMVVGGDGFGNDGGVSALKKSL